MYVTLIILALNLLKCSQWPTRQVEEPSKTVLKVKNLYDKSDQVSCELLV
jgi:hypothetical protein